MRSWGLAVTPKGRNAMLSRDREEFLRMENRNFKNELKNQKRESKFELAQYKQIRNAYYKDKAQKKFIDDKLKAKYGLLKDKKGRPVNYVRQFQRFNRGIQTSKIVPRNVSNQFNARPLPQRSEKWNPFEHKSEVEVYGDEDLTLFDGDKRGDDDTGSLFGFGKRRSQ